MIWKIVWWKFWCNNMKNSHWYHLALSCPVLAPKFALKYQYSSCHAISCKAIVFWKKLIKKVPCKASCCPLSADKQSHCLSWKLKSGSVLSQFTTYLKSMGSYIPRLAPWYWANPSSAKSTSECVEEDEVGTFKCFSNNPLILLGRQSQIWKLSFHAIFFSFFIRIRCVS